MSQRLACSPYCSARCIRAQGLQKKRLTLPSLLYDPIPRGFATPPPSASKSDRQYDHDPAQAASKTGQREGAMSQRLSEMTETHFSENSRGSQKTIEEAGFNEELKERLLARVEEARFQHENAAALSLANMPSSAGQASRDIAAAKPWSGTESTEDAALRMLNDAYKPMKVPFKVPRPRGVAPVPKKIDTGRSGKAAATGARLANARDKTSRYPYLKDDTLSESEREQLRKDLKDRFTPSARSVPVTLQGLASLANERIEDAIARGQFKNLPRGKIIERDYNMSSPFIDTTEYFMNKIIQKQEIVPPWIEKQQELVSSVSNFRKRIRDDWRRHAARLISSAGGSLEQQVARAVEYAAAEAVQNPPKRREVRMNAIDNSGNLSEISIAEERKPSGGVDSTDKPTDIITVIENTIEGHQSVENTTNEYDSKDQVAIEAKVGPERTAVAETGPADSASTKMSGSESGPASGTAVAGVFRSKAWEQAERGYHIAAIENLNSMTRSYNLMAPNLAKKPYFSYERELKSMYADVAPQLPDAIRERSTSPRPVQLNVVGKQQGGILAQIAGDSVRVHDERRPRYGFKEFWRDLFASPSS